MKKFTLITLIFFFVFNNITAQQEKGITGFDNWLESWTNFKPNKVNYDEASQILSGSISENTKLTKRNTYLLLGDVFVTDNAILTIEPGTVIIGDYKTKGSLTISKGSKVIAEGTPTDPIIFTSSRSDKKQGDWGGLFILGNASTNAKTKVSALNYGLKPASNDYINYGGDVINDNSGVLKYVRVEFAGKKTKEFGNFNAITLAGVGSGTTIENVMVSYCEGNSFYILGGDVVIEKAVSLRAQRNDYQFNYGAQCKLINSLAVRSPYISSPDGSRCLYISSYDQKEETDSSKKNTSVNAQNLTFINISNDLKADMKIGLVHEAIYIDTDVAVTIDKSVISGFKPAILFDTKINLNTENLEKIQFTSSYFNNCEGNIFRKGYTNNDDLESWYGSRAFSNVYSKGPDSETFINTKSSKAPDYRLRINKIAASDNILDDDDD